MGVPLSGIISNIFGRKLALIISALFFMIFIIIEARAPNYNILFISRFMLGIAVGFASFVVPLYLSEFAPT